MIIPKHHERNKLARPAVCMRHPITVPITAARTQSESAQRQLSRWLRGLIVVHSNFGSANASLLRFFRDQAATAPPPRAPKQAPRDVAFASMGTAAGSGGGPKWESGRMDACALRRSLSMTLLDEAQGRVQYKAHAKLAKLRAPPKLGQDWVFCVVLDCMCAIPAYSLAHMGCAAARRAVHLPLGRSSVVHRGTCSPATCSCNFDVRGVRGRARRRAVPSAFDVSGLVHMGAPQGAPLPAAPLMRWSTEAPGPRLPADDRPRATGGRASGRISSGAAPAPGGSRLLASLVRAPSSGGGSGCGGGVFAASGRGAGLGSRQSQGGASLIDSLESAMDRGRPLPAAPVLAQAPASAPQRFAGAPRQAFARATQHACAAAGEGPSRGPALRPEPVLALRQAPGTARQPSCAAVVAEPLRGPPAPDLARQPAAGRATPPARGGALAGPAAGAPKCELAAPGAAPKESAAEYMARLKQELKPERFARIEALLRGYKAVRHPRGWCQPWKCRARIHLGHEGALPLSTILPST